LKRAIVNKYGGPEIVIELHAQYYGTSQPTAFFKEKDVSQNANV
jgi:hypothetical protein